MPLLGPLCAVAGRSWGSCWRSWAALGAYVGGLEASVGVAVLGRLGLKKVEEYDSFEIVLISRAGARSAAPRAV